MRRPTAKLKDVVCCNIGPQARKRKQTMMCCTRTSLILRRHKEVRIATTLTWLPKREFMASNHRDHRPEQQWQE